MSIVNSNITFGMIERAQINYKEKDIDLNHIIHVQITDNSVVPKVLVQTNSEMITINNYSSDPVPISFDLSKASGFDISNTAGLKLKFVINLLTYFPVNMDYTSENLKSKIREQMTLKKMIRTSQFKIQFQQVLL